MEKKGKVGRKRRWLMMMRRGKRRTAAAELVLGGKGKAKRGWNGGGVNVGPSLGGMRGGTDSE